MSDIAQRMALDIAKEVPSVYAGGRLERAIDHALQKHLPAHDQEVREEVAWEIHDAREAAERAGDLGFGFMLGLRRAEQVARGGEES
jgi:hypothetical protein